MERLMVLVMLLSVISHAQSASEVLEDPGNAFVRKCSVVEKERDLTTVDQAYQMVCSAYVSGFVEGVVFAVDSVRSKGDQKAPRIISSAKSMPYFGIGEQGSWTLPRR